MKLSYLNNKNKALINKIRVNQCYYSILAEQQRCREISEIEFMSKYSFFNKTFNLAVARLVKEGEIEISDNIIKFK